MYHTKQDPQSLNVNVRQQLDSLFIGAVMNETSLVEYARTKMLVSYSGGYSYNVLSTMQRNMDTVKKVFPALYDEFRGILMARVYESRRGGRSLFYVCDKYVNMFVNLRLFTYNEIESVLSRYH